MNIVIVPVDFSDVSENAAWYAVKLLTGHPEIEIILYHAFQKPLEEENCNENLEVLKTKLLHNRDLNITTLAEHGDFITELDKLTRHRQADLVIMGITERSLLSQFFAGSNALKMAETKYCPVMIIPSNAQFSEIKNVLLTSDFKNVQSTTPSSPVKNILKTFEAKLHIVNVDTSHYIEITEAYNTEKERLKEMFAEFNPDFYFLRLYDIDDAISKFAKDKKIDLIVTIQKDHSLIHKFFNTSHSRNLAYQSTIPVMVMHE